MSTTTEAAQGSPAPDQDFDEQAGVYGFFRRHQKKLLFTAGFFTLLTFSIAGSIDGLVSSLTARDRETATIMVNGERVNLTGEDYRYGSLLARNWRQGLPYGVMLALKSGDGGDSELGEVFAIMRRVAIAEGLEPSGIEVTKAIEAARELAQAESPSKLAVSRGFDSLAAYRLLVYEAMRVGMFTRLQMLALDTSEAEAMRQILLHRETVAFKVATFDEKARQEEMKEKSELTDEDLKTWLEDQDDSKKARMNAFDLPVVQLRFGALQTGEGQFNPEEWQDTVLEGFVVGDDQLSPVYETYKENFKVEGSEDEYLTIEDEAVREKLTKYAQAERVVADLNTKLKQIQLDQLKPKSEEVAKAQSAVNDAQSVQSAANKKKILKERELTAKQEELAKDAENAELKAAVAALEAELTTAKDELFAAEPVLAQMKTAFDEAKKAESDARTNFDFVVEFDKLVAGKSGFVQKSMDKKVNAEELKDLDALGLDLGRWELAMAAVGLREAGAIGNGVGITPKAVLLYQATDLDSRPLKPWDELKPLLQDAYWAEKSSEEGKEKVAAMQDALLKLAKEKIPEFIAEREAGRQGRIDELLTEWEEGLDKGIAQASEMLKKPGLGTQARNAWQTKLDRNKSMKENKDKQVVRLERKVDVEITAEIKEEAKKHYQSVIDAAAAEAGYTVTEIGPYPRNLKSRPRFDYDYDPTIVYTYKNQSELEPGDAIGPVGDKAERRSYVIVCTNVEPITVDDVTRREFEFWNGDFISRQQQNAQSNAFTRDALKIRYALESDVGRQEELE
jgi:hypothetical protein